MDEVIVAMNTSPYDPSATHQAHSHRWWKTLLMFIRFPSYDAPAFQQFHRLYQWWISPLVGYPVTILLTAIAVLIPWAERVVGIQNFFISSPFVILTLVVGSFWGAGPALLSLVSEAFALDYYIVPPLYEFSFFRWPDIISFGPFILVQLIALWLILLLRHYRHQLFLAGKKMAEHITMIDEVNSELERAHRSRDVFMSQAAHELRTPLTTLRGIVQLILRRLVKEPPSTNHDFLMANLARIDAQTHRLRILVDDLLSFSYLSSGKIPLRPGPCDLKALCREIINNLNVWNERTIELNSSSDQIVIQADKNRLSEVVLNLVNNAIKYSPVQTIVRVEIGRGPDEALLAVHNDGSCLSEDQQKHLFEPFYRSPEVWSSAVLGWGLGLAISKQFVEQHCGRIWVESSVEQGTTFFVALPYVCNVQADADFSASSSR